MPELSLYRDIEENISNKQVGSTHNIWFKFERYLSESRPEHRLFWQNFSAESRYVQQIKRVSTWHQFMPASFHVLSDT
jgi:hypothetical protein